MHKLYFINEAFERKLKASNSGDRNRLEGQGRILSMLKVRDMISTKDLSIILGVSVSSVNSLLAKLEKKALIEKVPSEEDKRVLLIKITEKGLKYKVEPPVNYSVFNCLNDEEKKQFDSYLTKIIIELKKDLGEDDPKFSKKRRKLFEEIFDLDDSEEWLDLV